MDTLVVGGTGATGRQLVEQLLERGHGVRAIVRTPEGLPASVREHPRLAVTRAPVLDLDRAQLASLVEGCGAVASCLGHRMTLRGVFGPPRRLVRDATRRLCEAIRASHPDHPVKVVLMNAAGNRNRDVDEPISVGQRVVLGLLRLLVPPHADNEAAAEVLRTEIGQDDPAIEWVAVRPDGLVDEGEVTAYDAHPSPTRSAIFDAGRTSRINVAHFMATLIDDDEAWSRWKGRMPVIYDRESAPART